MIDHPKTKEEASNYRYNKWAGNPSGTQYDSTRCAYEVYDGHHMFYQCQRKPGKGPNGLYCGQHDKMVTK